ncbi:MAG: 30S ribosomal protein S6 [Desulfovibrionaceae bacterium]
MRKFETLLLLSPELSAEERDTLIESLVSTITKENGSNIEVDKWGMKELAYPVKKQTRGFYVRLEYKAPSTLVTELERTIRISENIYKFLTVKLEETVK